MHAHNLAINLGYRTQTWTSKQGQNLKQCHANPVPRVNAFA